MDFASLPRAAENRTSWKGIVVKSSVGTKFHTPAYLHIGSYTFCCQRATLFFRASFIHHIKKLIILVTPSIFRINLDLFTNGN